MDCVSALTRFHHTKLRRVGPPIPWLKTSRIKRWKTSRIRGCWAIGGSRNPWPFRPLNADPQALASIARTRRRVESGPGTSDGQRRVCLAAVAGAEDHAAQSVTWLWRQSMTQLGRVADDPDLAPAKRIRHQRSVLLAKGLDDLRGRMQPWLARRNSENHVLGCASPLVFERAPKLLDRLVHG
jgi:hypothetical protein